ncbi:MAG: hypothetical protein RL161_1313, partial [Bacteroidota bacterium]
MKKSVTKNKAQKNTVAIQGIAASFHELAARTFFGESITTIEC